MIAIATYGGTIAPQDSPTDLPVSYLGFIKTQYGITIPARRDLSLPSNEQT